MLNYLNKISKDDEKKINEKAFIKWGQPTVRIPKSSPRDRYPGFIPIFILPIIIRDEQRDEKESERSPKSSSESTGDNCLFSSFFIRFPSFSFCKEFVRFFPFT